MIKKTLMFFFTMLSKPFGYVKIINYLYRNNIKTTLLKKNVRWKSKPNVNQKIFFNGQGKVEIGTNSSFGYRLGGFNYKGSIELQARYKESKIIIGNNVATNNNLYLCAANFIEIGDNTLIGQNVTIMDHEAHGIEPENRRRLGKIGKVIVGKNVWIGNNVTILKNVIIGDNTVIATGAIVTKCFPANVVIGGIPARVIDNIKSEEV